MNLNPIHLLNLTLLHNLFIENQNFKNFLACFLIYLHRFDFKKQIIQHYFSLKIHLRYPSINSN